MHLSEDIKTLDMSLPSYDSINTLKQSDKALGVENLPEETKTPVTKKKKNSDGGGGGGGGGNPLGKVLPSMNKSVGKKPKGEKTANTRKAAIPFSSSSDDDDDDEIKTMDTSLPSYGDSTQGKRKSAFAL
jgi:hypothetical protein